MTIDTFFEKFDLFAEAPDAVEKMRELILQLAVRGRLSEYRASDTPVSNLISALSNAKAMSEKNGRCRNVATVPSELDINGPIDTPPHWAWVPLYEIGFMSGGMTPSKEKPAFWDGEVNWFSSKDIKSDELTDSELKITREATKATGLQVYSPGCLVMVARSGILKRTFPVSILRAEGTVNQDLKVLTPFVSGIERYLQIMLRGMTSFILTSLVKTGMTVQSLKYDEFEAQCFPLPPLAEQNRIVAKVDEFMGLCDRLEAQRKDREERAAALARASLERFSADPSPANLEFLFHRSYAVSPADLRKAILELAVRGKLVKQEEGDESATALLARINTFKKSQIDLLKGRQGKVSRPLTSLDAPLNMPQGWQWTNIDALCFKVTDGTHFTPHYLDCGIRFVSAKDIVDGRLVFDRCRFISEEEHKVLYRRCNPEFHDIIISKSGTIGAVALIEDHGEFCLFESLALLKYDQENIFPWYFVIALKNACDSLTSGHIRGVGVKHLHLDILRSLELPLPPLSEQKRIVAKVDELLALVDMLESDIAASRDKAKALLAAAVAELVR